MPHEDKPAFWKKEISFGRKSQEPAEAEPVVEAAEPAEPVAEPTPIQEPVAVEEPPAPTAAVEQMAQDESAHSWLTRPLEEISDPPAQLETPAVEATPKVPDAVTPSVEAVAVVELPDVIEPLAEQSEEPAVSLPEPPPEPEVEKVPFYKRELSFKRSPRADAPKPEKPKRVEERAPKGERVPLHKRELSLKRRPKSRPAEAWETEDTERPKLRRLSPPKPSARTPKGAKRFVGLKIGASQIAAARVVNGGEPELLQVAREPLEHGIVVGGELRDPDALAVALRAFFKRHNLPRRGIRLGIANNRIGVRIFDVLGIEDPKQLANAVRFRAQEVLPIPIEEAVLDYHVLSESTNEEGLSTRRVLLVVAYREVVDRYLDACRKAGLQIVGIDLEAFALLRALSPPREQTPGAQPVAVVAVSIGHDRSTFAVSDGRVCEFTRVLEWGGWALNVAIARALDTAPSEAEAIKRALSFTGAEQRLEALSDEQLATAREAARRQLQTFARELVSSLQFYQSQPASLGIAEIVITGGTAHLPGLGDELQRLVGVPVRVGDPLCRVRVSKNVQKDDQIGSLAIAIGLGIED